MTQKKLEIIGPYTPEHEGPFCTRDGRPVRILCRDMKGDFPIAGAVYHAGALGKEAVCSYDPEGWATKAKVDHPYDLMNAREVPVAREFWVNEYSWGFGPLMASYEGARQKRDLGQYIRTIHVREVLPGEGE
ncbi:hypothetical protein [Acetobacter ghanensis]|uniref:Uncharacterized protein n=1 Tax=Acetobacter ghanensis TaxID=431306 RepID=A0A0U5BH67_9PROT|nr:hypothetical protein [Acetobacter ghanensis]NHO39437.1 hypothetical protein [Acetobacter ghanensis]GBQ46519.1 hypothetical protein AA18895_0789 [Acetobacter ghanensis DSM 18895]CEF54573.1 hypothetical protein predicted by Glimmer/Critica [Acetobacter ghanensis]